MFELSFIGRVFPSFDVDGLGYSSCEIEQGVAQVSSI